MIRNLLRVPLDDLIRNLIGDPEGIDDWILTTGFWRDIGEWQDDDVWID